MDTLDDQSSRGGSIPTPSLQSIRIAQPLFPVEGQGSIPMSPLQFEIEIMDIDKAIQLNKYWHSRLPIISNPKCGDTISFGAIYKNIYFACAIWTRPIARMFNNLGYLELRRMAISNDSPKNTASRMIKIMTILIKKNLLHINKLISYQDTEVHNGTIYKASNWIQNIANKNSSWDRPNINRRRTLNQATGIKIRWEKQIRPEPEATIKPPKKIPQKGLFF